MSEYDRIEITDEMVRDCIENPVPSRRHEWQDRQQGEYNLLKWRGRSFYDQLRTKFNVEHMQAFVWSADLFGKKN